VAGIGNHSEQAGFLADKVKGSAENTDP